MSSEPEEDGPAPRAARLLRWYPKAWRSRYGEEFTELLMAEISERPRSWSRTADVIRGGIVSWASTLSVSSFWAHPAALAAFPAAEITWMALSPLAVACVTMAVFLCGCCAWIADRAQGPGNLFHPGAIDVAGAAVMTVALAVARQAVRQARAGAR